MKKDPRELLDDLRWLQGLARRLVNDPHRADDAVQETMVIAVTRGPSEPGKLRSWLGSILRNTLRQERRREQRRGDRERLAARAEALPSAADLAEELSLQRRLVEHVHALAEPYRSTLVLRFLRELAPRRIAEAQGVPVKTVHTRIERGLALLRERLDRSWGGDRPAWMIALSSLADARLPGPALGIGAALVTMKLELLAALVLVLAAGVWWNLSNRDAQPDLAAAPSAAAMAELEQPVPPTPVAEPDPATERVALEAPQVAPTRAAAPEPEPPSLRLQGRVIELDGRAVSGVLVRFERSAGVGVGDSFEAAPDVPAARSDERGAFELTAPLEVGRLTVESARFACIARPFVEPPLDGRELRIVVAPARAYAGRVVDTDGRPIAGVAVGVSLPGSFLQSLALPAGSGAGTPEAREALHVVVPLAEARTGEDGTFAFDSVAWLERVQVEAARDGYQPAALELSPVSDLTLELVLEPAEAGPRSVYGLVLDATGSPVPDAQVSLGFDAVRSDPEGRFVLELYSHLLGRPVRVHAVRAGLLPGSTELEWQAGGPGSDPSRPLRIDLGPAPLELRGRVVDALGRPAPGAVVWTSDTTWFGMATVERSGHRVTTPVTAENLTLERGGAGPGFGAVETVAGEDGRFVLGGLLPRDYRVFALLPETLEAAGPLACRAGRTDVELTLSGGLTQPVAGRVLSRSGRPLAGLRVSIGRRLATSDSAAVDPSWSQSPLTPPGSSKLFLDQAATTDEEGRFDLGPRVVEGVFLHVEGPAVGLGARRVLEPEEDTERIEFVVDAASRFRIVLDDPTEADAFEIVLEEPGDLPLLVEVEGSTISTPQVDLHDGVSGVVLGREGSSTLVLMRDGEPVRRARVELPAGGVHEIRP